MNRVGYSGAKTYYTCLINFKKYTSQCLAGCIRTEWNSFCFWNRWENKIKTLNVRFPHKNFFRSPASTQSCDTTRCPSWHSVQSLSCSQFSSQYLIEQKPDSYSFNSSSHILFILCTTLFKAFPFITDLCVLHSWGEWIFAYDSRRIYNLFLQLQWIQQI